MRGLFHRLVHRFGLNTGDVHTWWDGQRLMVGFKCRHCGEVSDAHESMTTRRKWL